MSDIVKYLTNLSLFQLVFLIFFLSLIVIILLVVFFKILNLTFEKTEKGFRVIRLDKKESINLSLILDKRREITRRQVEEEIFNCFQKQKKALVDVVTSIKNDLFETYKNLYLNKVITSEDFDYKMFRVTLQIFENLLKKELINIILENGFDKMVEEEFNYRIKQKKKTVFILLSNVMEEEYIYINGVSKIKREEILNGLRKELDDEMGKYIETIFISAKNYRAASVALINQLEEEFKNFLKKEGVEL